MFRTGGSDDLESLVSLEREASSAALHHIFGDIPFPVDDVRARWALLLAEGSSTVLIDEDEGVMVGYAAYGDGWLHHFAVTPRLWGTGRAMRMHDEVLTRAAAGDAPTTYLWVLVENHRAQAFYTRMGWHDSGVREPEVFAPYPVKMRMDRGCP